MLKDHSTGNRHGFSFTDLRDILICIYLFYSQIEVCFPCFVFFIAVMSLKLS